MTIFPVKNPETIATTIRIGAPVSDIKALNAIYDSNGYSETVSDEEILNAQKLLARTEGIGVEPASAASIAGLKKLVDEGVIDKGETITCVVTGHLLKDPNVAIDACRPRAPSSWWSSCPPRAGTRFSPKRPRRIGGWPVSSPGPGPAATPWWGRGMRKRPSRCRPSPRSTRTSARPRPRPNCAAGISAVLGYLFDKNKGLSSYGDIIIGVMILAIGLILTFNPSLDRKSVV